MLSSPTPPRARARALEVLGALVAGLVLVFGGTCGVGPTSLSLLAVSANQVATPDDVRTHAPVPVASESTAPARRVLRRRVAGAVARRAATVARAVAAVVSSARATRAPPPLRGPPALAG